jgi:phosphatidylserine/phosphatidylglycerophosphate/cardiolipin synthase-like enzyme
VIATYPHIRKKQDVWWLYPGTIIARFISHCYNNSMSRSRRSIKLWQALALLLLVGLVWLSRANPFSSVPGETQSRPTAVAPQPAVVSGGISLYFTAPDSPTAGTLRGGPDAALAEAIRQARVSVDVAVMQLNLWSMRDALLSAHRRGVAVRVVVESDYGDTPEVEALREAGIPVLGDRRESTMHHKFTIIDRQEVWTGSMNYSINDAYRNHNALLRIASPELATSYLAEFEKMFVYDRFGTASRQDTPQPIVTVEGTQVEVLFSPDDGVAARIEALLLGAEQSIDVLAYSFTLNVLADALIERHAVGVVVRGVFEDSQALSNRGGDYERLRAAGLDIRLDVRAGNMHHKTIVIDRGITATGSYNFSNNAETRNDENVLVIHDVEIAGAFMAEFERLFAAGSHAEQDK